MTDVYDDVMAESQADERSEGEGLYGAPAGLVPVLSQILTGWKRQIREEIESELRAENIECAYPAQLELAPSGPPKMAVLPDGIGIDLEQVSQLIAEKCKIIVSKDDPILMVATVCNAMIAQENVLLERHRTALTQVMAEKTDGFVNAVQTAVKQTGETFAGATVDAMKQTIHGHHNVLENHRKNVLWLSAIVVISALVNVIVFVWQALK